MLNTRSVSHRRYDFAKVNGGEGLILYPDDYTPAGAGVGAVTSKGTVSADNWYKMQAAGCTFLPSAGYGNPVRYQGEYGYYWLDKPGSYNKHALVIYLPSVYITINGGTYGFEPTDSNRYSVRLVKNL